MKNSLILFIATLCLMCTGCNGKYQLRLGWKIPIQMDPKPLNYWELSTLLVPNVKDFRSRAVTDEGQLLSQYLPAHEYRFDAHTKIRESEWALKSAIQVETKARLLANSLKYRNATFADFERFIDFSNLVQTEYAKAKKSYLYFYCDKPKELTRKDIEKSYLEYRWPLIAQYNARLRLAEIESIKITISELKGASFSTNSQKLDEIEKEHKEIEQMLQGISRELTEKTILNQNSASLLNIMVQLKKMVMSADSLAESVAQYRHWAQKHDRRLLNEPLLVLADKNIQSIYTLSMDTNAHIWTRLKGKTKAWKTKLDEVERQIIGLSHHQAIRMLSKLQTLELEFNHFRAGEERLLAYVENTIYEQAVLRHVAEQLKSLYGKLKPFLPKANQKNLHKTTKTTEDWYEKIHFQPFTVLSIDVKGLEELTLVLSESKMPETTVKTEVVQLDKPIIVSAGDQIESKVIVVCSSHTSNLRVQKEKNQEDTSLLCGFSVNIRPEYNLNLIFLAVALISLAASFGVPQQNLVPRLKFKT